MRVLFRNVTLQDLTMLCVHRNMVSTRKWLENERLINKVDQLAWFERGGGRDFKIVESDLGQPLGLARIASISDLETQVGFDLFQEFRGKGLGKFIFSRIVELASEQGALLSLWVFVENEAAVKIYKSLGFTFDRTVSPKFLAREWDETGTVYEYRYMILKRGSTSLPKAPLRG